MSNSWPPPPGSMPSLNPPTLASQGQAAGDQWYRHQVYYPEPPFPMSKETALQPRLRPITSLVNVAINTSTPRTIQFDIPCAVYAVSAAAVKTDGQALPAGMDPLNTFTIQYEHTNGDRFSTAAGLGSTMVGDAKFPMLLGGVGWLFDRGSALLTTVVPLQANMRIDVVFWTIEIRGGRNYGVPGR